MAEKEWPYHVQGIYDLEADYSPEHFRFVIGECREVIAQLIAEDQSSNQQIARVHICDISICNFRGLPAGPMVTLI
jgi:hypothetical protein